MNIPEIHKTEQKILEILSTQKEVSISQLALRIKISRTSIYNALKKLLTKKLIVKDNYNYGLNKNITTSPLSIYTDSNILIEKLMKELLTLKRGEIIYSIEADSEIRTLVKDRNWFLKWQNKIIKNGIVLKGVGSNNGLLLLKNILNENEKSKLKGRSGSARFIPTEINTHINLVVFRNSTVLFSRKLNIFQRIDNKNISDTFRIIIDSLYLSGSGDVI
jgi:DNA-binding Lrp family transcriptional regulator